MIGNRERTFDEGPSYRVVVDDTGAPDSGGANGTDVRTRILVAATELIAGGGIEAATTRAVGVAAGVQAPTIYRLFGDKRGLLEAAAEHGLAMFVADKSVVVMSDDPVHDLRRGWDLNVEFGVANPGLFSIMSSDPHLRTQSPALAVGSNMLGNVINRIALAGRLRVSEERAVALMQSAGVGTVLTLLGQPYETRDMGLSEAAREAAIAAITGEPVTTTNPGPSDFARALLASLNRRSMLSPGEHLLLKELLHRIANGG